MSYLKINCSKEKIKLIKKLMKEYFYIKNHNLLFYQTLQMAVLTKKNNKK